MGSFTNNRTLPHASDWSVRLSSLSSIPVAARISSNVSESLWPLNNRQTTAWNKDTASYLVPHFGNSARNTQ